MKDFKKESSIWFIFLLYIRTYRPHIKTWLTKSRRVALKVIKSRVHFFMKLVVLTVNLALLMSLHYPLIEPLDSTICKLIEIFQFI